MVSSYNYNNLSFDTETRVFLEIEAGQAFALIGALRVDAFAVDARNRLAFVNVCAKQRHKLLACKGDSGEMTIPKQMFPRAL